MTEPRVLMEATIAGNAVRYQLTALGAALAASIVGIIVIPLALPVASWYWRRYYARLSVRLTTRELKVDRGVLVREEKAIPLEKVTDLAVVQGPVMRWMGLKGIKVETAGQSSGPSALVNIVGIEDVDGFRDRVLAQRDRVTDREAESPTAARQVEAIAPASPVAGAEMLDVMREIRDSLRRIEERVAIGEGTGPDARER